MADISTSLPETSRHVLAQRSLMTAMLRGLGQHCPACGKGALFHRYLKVNDNCPNCAEELHHHRADDAPPYFTILIVGHIIVPAMLALEKFSAPPLWLHSLIWIPLTLLLSLAILPLAKGALVGLQWALHMHGFDPNAAPEGEPRLP